MLLLHQTQHAVQLRLVLRLLRQQLRRSDLPERTHRVPDAGDRVRQAAGERANARRRRAEGRMGLLVRHRLDVQRREFIEQPVRRALDPEELLIRQWRCHVGSSRN